MVFTYAFRSLRANLRTTIGAIVMIVASAAAITVVLGLVEGLYSTLGETGSPQNAVILREHALDEVSSSIPRESLGMLKALPKIAVQGATQLVSPEYIVPLPFHRPGGDVDTVRIRGVDPVAFTVHEGMTVTGGAMPHAAMPGLVIGARLVGRYAGFREGGTIRIGRAQWPVVGILRAPGTAFESELWCDRTALSDLTHVTSVNTVVMRLESAADQAEVANALSRNLAAHLESVPEREYYGRLLRQVGFYLKTIVFIVFLLAMGAVLAGTNSMYAMFLTRIGEIATLIAIGYTHRRVAAMMVIEALLLATFSGALGVALAMLANGHVIAFPELTLTYTIKMSARVLVAGLAIAFSIGALSSVIVVIKTLRVRVIEGLRE